MELRQLEHFVAVAELRHFTRAAEVMSISQSGLSASIRALERELHAPLFVRTTRRVELTEAGRALLCESRRTLASASAARQAVAAVQGLQRGTLVIGAEQGIDAVDVPGLVARFRVAHPRLEIVLRQAGTASLLEDLEGRRLDVGFVATVPDAVEGIELRALTTERMVVVCHPGHRLAGRRDVCLERLAREEFVDFPAASGARMIVDRAFTAAGIERRVTAEVNDVETLRALVSHGVGIAVVPAPMSCRLPQIGLGEGAIDDWQVSIAVASDGLRSLAAEAFLALLGPTAAGLAEPRVPALTW